MLVMSLFSGAFSYPNSADKQLLARAIVTLFPALQIKMEEENEGYVSTFS